MVTIIDHHHHILPHPHLDDHHGNCEKTNVHCCLMLLPPLARPLLASIMEQGVLHSTTIQTNPIKQGVLHSTTIQTNTTLFYIFNGLLHISLDAMPIMEQGLLHSTTIQTNPIKQLNYNIYHNFCS